MTRREWAETVLGAAALVLVAWAAIWFLWVAYGPTEAAPVAPSSTSAVYTGGQEVAP